MERTESSTVTIKRGEGNRALGLESLEEQTATIECRRPIVEPTRIIRSFLARTAPRLSRGESVAGSRKFWSARGQGRHSAWYYWNYTIWTGKQFATSRQRSLQIVNLNRRTRRVWRCTRFAGQFQPRLGGSRAWMRRQMSLLDNQHPYQ